MWFLSTYYTDSNYIKELFAYSLRGQLGSYHNQWYPIAGTSGSTREVKPLSRKAILDQAERDGEVEVGGSCY